MGDCSNGKVPGFAEVPPLESFDGVLDAAVGAGGLETVLLVVLGVLCIVVLAVDLKVPPLPFFFFLAASAAFFFFFASAFFFFTLL